MGKKLLALEAESRGIAAEMVEFQEYVMRLAKG